MDFLVGIHNLIRWVIVLIAVIAGVRYTLVLAGRAAPGSMDRGLMSGYAGLLDLNVLLGLIVIVSASISAGQLALAWVEHAVVNIIGVAAAHIFAQRARKETDDKAAARLRLIGAAASMAIIVVGVAIVGGWQR